MSINLSNLKAGQTRELEDGTTVTRDTETSTYTFVRDGKAATVNYDKDAKTWFVAFEGGTPQATTGATAKTIADLVLANWPASEPEADDEAAEEPADEATEQDEDAEKAAADKANGKREKALSKLEAAMRLAQDPNTSPDEAEAALAAIARLMERNSISEEELRRRMAEAKDEKPSDEPLATWTWNVNMLGGHGPHRVVAYASVAQAMGGGVFYVHDKPKGVGYKYHTITLHVVAQESVINNMKTLFPMIELQMERLAEDISKRVSREARLEGRHHSGPGCHARRGFMRGFGAGIASRIAKGKKAMSKEDSTGSTALVIRDREAQVEAYMKLHHSDLKTVKPQKFDQDAYREGHAAGRAFASPQVATESAAKQLENA